MTGRRLRSTGRLLSLLLVTVALVLLCVQSAVASAGGVTIITEPGLQPSFDPAVPNYVTRCGSAGELAVLVTDTSHTPVSVDQGVSHTTNFASTVRLSAGQRFTVRVGSGPTAASYNIRCLPNDFPGFTAHRTAQPEAAYYLLTTTLTGIAAPGPPYVVLFDNHGVPVWWWRQPSGIPLNAFLLSDGDFAWYVEAPPVLEFGYPSAVHLEERGLSGALSGVLTTATTPTDFHEGLQLPDGDFLMTSYALRTAVDLSSVGMSSSGAVVDATFQEIRPDGSVAYRWSSAGKIAPTENTDSRFQWLPYPGVDAVWDMEHINSVEPYGDGFLVSMRYLNAIFLIRRSDGAVEWKLGGTTTPQSLTITNGPVNFDNQHDARVLPDGTISIHDNGTYRPPRVLRFRINALAHTATLVQTINGPPGTTSSCCGSSRLLPGGDWVVDWGGIGTTEELAPDGNPVLSITLAPPYFSYRTFPVLPGQLSPAALIAGMDAMHPRKPAGGGSSQVPVLSALRVSPTRFVLAGRRLRGRCVSIAAAPRHGAPCRRRAQLRVVFVLRQTATVSFRVQELLSGRVRGGRCVRATHASSRQPHCTLVLSLPGGFTRSGVFGANSFTWIARVGNRFLGPGTYRLTATPRHRGTSRTEAAMFKLAVRPGRRGHPTLCGPNSPSGNVGCGY